MGTRGSGFGGKNLGGLAVLAVVVVGLGAVQFFRTGGVAPTPAAFTPTGTLESAIAEARAENKVVLAVATADWCGPCQSFKRGALADAEVRSWIEANAVAVMIDVDAAPEDAQRLGVRSIPATYFIHDGRVVADFVGARDPRTLLEWLSTHASAVR